MNSNCDNSNNSNSDKTSSTNSNNDNRKGLLGITYSEFDNKVGPRLLYAYPSGILSSETFETLSDYVIVGKHLCNKIIAIKTDDFQFINYSVAIDNSKYERNTLLFSFGFILSNDDDLKSNGLSKECYEQVLRKISIVFLNLEIEREFLFNEVINITIIIINIIIISNIIIIINIIIISNIIISNIIIINIKYHHYEEH